MTTSVKPMLAGTAVVMFALLGVAVAAEAAPAEARADDVTYAKDVAPIIFNNCLVCHRPGQVAPMPFRDYKETRPWARAIKDKVQSREMPPWFADPQYGEWLNDRRLSQEQIDTIAAWVDAGAPMGEASDIPEPPMFSDNWALGDLGDPDLIVPMPVTVEVPADGEEGYQQYYVKNDLTEDKFIKGIEVRPGKSRRRAPRRHRHGQATAVLRARRPWPAHAGAGLRTGRQRTTVRLLARELQADRLRTR